VALQGQGSAAGSLGSGGTGTQGDEMPWAEAEVICGQAPLSSISQLSVSNLAVTGQINVLGNVVANYLIGNGSQLTGVLPATANININGNLTGSYANVANVIAVAGNVVNLNVTGNLAMTSNARIFSHQQQFMWNGSVFGSPNIAGNNIVTATAQGTNGGYLGPVGGWGFTSSTNQFSSLAWNSGFDFTKDFRVDTSVYSSANAGTIWISVGGSNNGGTNPPSAVNNGALTSAFNLTQTSYSTTYYNGNVLNTTSSLHYANAIWVPLSLTVQSVVGKRYLTVYSASGAVEACADVSTWVPSGSYLVIGGNTTAVTSSQYLNNVRLSYL
jgi:hypothetical protein